MKTPAISPMLATLGRPPETFADFAVEAKYDGQRGLAVVDKGVVKLLSRNGCRHHLYLSRDHHRTSETRATAARCWTARLWRSITRASHPLAAYSGGGRKTADPAQTILRQVPVRFYVFDVLSLDGRDITKQPYAARRDHLSAIAANSTRRIVQFPSNWTDTDPQMVLAASAELGLEGIVCKHLHSRYTPGLRSRDWIKTPHRHTVGPFSSGLTQTVAWCSAAWLEPG